MTNTFKLKKGEISFENDKIRITDNSKKHNRFQLLNSIIWTIFGVFSILRYFKTGDQFSLWAGLFIGTAHLYIFSQNLRRTNQNEILVDEIKSIKIKQIFNNEVLDIKLKNNKLRRVTGIENSKDFEEFMQSTFENVLTK